MITIGLGAIDIGVQLVCCQKDGLYFTRLTASISFATIGPEM